MDEKPYARLTWICSTCGNEPLNEGTNLRCETCGHEFCPSNSGFADYIPDEEDEEDDD